MPLQETECMGAQLDVALQVCLEHEGVGALGGGEGPTSNCGRYCFGFSAFCCPYRNRSEYPSSAEILDKVD